MAGDKETIERMQSWLRRQAEERKERERSRKIESVKGHVHSLGHNFITNVGAIGHQARKDYPKIKKKAKPVANFFLGPAPKARCTQTKRTSANGVIVNGKFYPAAKQKKSAPAARRPTRKTNPMFDFGVINIDDITL